MTKRALYVRLRNSLNVTRARLALELMRDSPVDEPSECFIHATIEFVKARDASHVERLMDRLVAGREALLSE